MDEDERNISLGLAIGGGGLFTSNQSRDGGRKTPVQFNILFPPRLKGEEVEEAIIEERHVNKSRSRSKNNIDEEEDASTKDMSDGVSNQFGMRKKLRLTKEQLTLLENSFQDHNTLNQTQKQELANQLNLQPRQVEVWFQNRRARTKLKQNEVDCELLKKCCENLSNENRRLKRELEELKSMKPGCPFYIGIPKVATLTLCPSCERTMAPGSAKGNGALVPVKNGLVSVYK